MEEDANALQAEADALEAELVKLRGLVAGLELDLGPLPSEEAKIDNASSLDSSTDSYISFISELLLRPSCPKAQECPQSAPTLAKGPEHGQLAVTDQITPTGLQEVQQETQGERMSWTEPDDKLPQQLNNMQQEGRDWEEDMEMQENEEEHRATKPIESGQLSTTEEQVQVLTERLEYDESQTDANDQIKTTITTEAQIEVLTERVECDESQKNVNDQTKKTITTEAQVQVLAERLECHKSQTNLNGDSEKTINIAGSSEQERRTETPVNVMYGPLEALAGQLQCHVQHAQQARSDASLRPDDRLLHTKRALLKAEKQATELQEQVHELQARAESKQLELVEAAARKQDALDEAAQEAAERRRLASESQRLQDALEMEQEEANHQILTLRSRYQSELQELRAQLNSRDAEAQNLQLRKASIEQVHEEDLHRANSQLQFEQRALLQCQSELAEVRAALQHDRFHSAQMRQENARLTADLKASATLTDSLRAELIGTGERATDQHAKCCELWVALENERLEAQHLRELYEVAKRESAAFTKQLQNQPRTEQKLPVQSSAYEPPSSPQQRCRTKQSLAHQPPSSPQQHCRPLQSVALELPSSPQQRCRALQSVALEPPSSPQQRCRPLQMAAHEPPASPRQQQCRSSHGVALELPPSPQQRSRPLRSAAHELPASPEQRYRPLQGAAHDPSQSPPQRPLSCAGTEQAHVTRATFPMRAHTERQHRSSPLDHGSGVPQEAPKMPRSAATSREQRDSVGSILRHGLFSQEEEKRRENQTTALEKQLMVLNGERAFLKGILLKYPSNFAGKTLAERRTKRDAEQRLEDVERTISNLKNSLRKLTEP